MLEKSFVEESKKPKISLDELIKRKDDKKISDYLEEGLNDYLNVEVFKHYLEFISKFPKYSQKNSRLILEQNANATYVTGLTSWKKKNRLLKKEPKVIYVYASSIQDKKDTEGKLVSDENGEIEKEIHYFLTPTFDVSQTTGEEEMRKTVYNLREKLDDRTFTQTYKTLEELSQSEVSIEPIENSETENSYTLPSENRIVIRQGLGELLTLKVLVREMTHALLDSNSSAVFGETDYRKEEFEADAVSYIITNHLGIDTSDLSFDYLSSWEQQGNKIEELTNSLEAITTQAKTLIEQIDRSLEKIYTLDAPRNKFEERVAIARGMKPEEPRTPTKQYEVQEPAKKTSEDSVSQRFGTKQMTTAGTKGSGNQ